MTNVPVSAIVIAPDPPPREAALQEQRGLRLQPIREPMDVLVIDRIERPAPN